MAEKEKTQDAAVATPPAPPKSFARRHWGKMTVGTLFGLPLALFALWTVVSLAFTFSSGPRVGYVQKISKKGWVCKTWEGELQMSNIPGSAPTLWQFTVRDDSVAQAIEATAGKHVKLNYSQHRFVPTSCFGETEYFVDHVEVIP